MNNQRRATLTELDAKRKTRHPRSTGAQRCRRNRSRIFKSAGLGFGRLEVGPRVHKSRWARLRRARREETRSTLIVSCLRRREGGARLEAITWGGTCGALSNASNKWHREWFRRRERRLLSQWWANYCWATTRSRRTTGRATTPRDSGSNL